MRITMHWVLSLATHAHTLQDAGDLPEYLVHAADNAAKHPLGHRARNTQLVNQAPYGEGDPLGTYFDIVCLSEHGLNILSEHIV